MRNLIKVLFIFSAFTAFASDDEGGSCEYVPTQKRSYLFADNLEDCCTDGEEGDSSSKNNSQNTLRYPNTTQNASDKKIREENYSQSIKNIRMKNALKQKRKETKPKNNSIAVQTDGYINNSVSEIDLRESRLSNSTETSELKSILDAFEKNEKPLSIINSLYDEKIEGVKSQEVEKLNVELLEKNKEIENLTKKVNGLDGARTPLKEEIQKLKEELNKVIAEKSHLIEENRKQNVKRHINDQKIYNAYSEEKKDFMRTINKLNQQIKNLENDLEKNKDNSIRTIPAETKTDFSKKSINIPKHLNPSAELELSKAENKTISDKLSSLESELKTKNKELDTANIKNKALEEVMKKEAEELKNEKSVLTQTVKEKDEEIEKLKIENKKMMEEKNIGFFTKVKNGASTFFNYIFSIPKKILSFF